MPMTSPPFAVSPAEAAPDAQAHRGRRVTKRQFDRHAARVSRLTRLRGARDLIDLRFGEQLDVAQLAAHAGYSRFHFIRAFHWAYGETPVQYLMRRRIERACELLALANLTIREIAELVGFTSLAGFSTRFKAQLGTSPSRYRDAMVQRGGPPPIPGCVLMWARQHPPRGARGNAVPKPTGGSPAETA
jgi:AraC-like DNA-binding protein